MLTNSPNGQLGFPISLDAAIPWALESLSGGLPIAELLRAEVRRFNRAWLLAERNLSAEGVEINDTGYRLNLGAATNQAQRLLPLLGSVGLKTLISELNPARKEDPWLTRAIDENYSFDGEFVFEWQEFDHPSSPPKELHSGYPGISYGCSDTPSQLGLTKQSSITELDRRRIVDSVQALFISCFDCEAWIILMTHDLATRLPALFDEIQTK